MLTSYFQELYMNPKILSSFPYYSNVIDNHDQRMTSDIDHYASSLSQIFPTLVLWLPLVIIYAIFCIEKVNRECLIAIALHFVIGGIVIQFLMWRVSKLTFIRDMNEGDFRQVIINGPPFCLFLNGSNVSMFRFLHVTLRKNMEELLTSQGLSVYLMHLKVYLVKLISTLQSLGLWNAAIEGKARTPTHGAPR